MIVNFGLVFFFGIFFISLEMVRRTESVQQKNHWKVTKMVFCFYSFCDQLVDSFIALTQCHKPISKKMAINAKKKKQSKLKITVLRKLGLETCYVDNVGTSNIIIRQVAQKC